MNTSAQLDTIYDLTMPVAISYPNLFKPKAFKGKNGQSGEPKYGAEFLFDTESADLKGIKTLVVRIAKAAWPDRQFFVTTTDGQKIKQIGTPWKSGNEKNEEAKKKGKTEQEHYKGKVILRASSKNQPVLGYIQPNGQKVFLETDTAIQLAKKHFDAGIEVYANFNFAIYEKGESGIPGITAYLNGVLSTTKGTRLAKGRSPDQMFRGYAGSVSGEDPTAPGGDDNIDDLI